MLAQLQRFHANAHRFPGPWACWEGPDGTLHGQETCTLPKGTKDSREACEVSFAEMLERSCTCMLLRSLVPQDPDSPLLGFLRHFEGLVDVYVELETCLTELELVPNTHSDSADALVLAWHVSTLATGLERSTPPGPEDFFALWADELAERARPFTTDVLKRARDSQALLELLACVAFPDLVSPLPLMAAVVATHAHAARANRAAVLATTGRVLVRHPADPARPAEVCRPLRLVLAAHAAGPGHSLLPPVAFWALPESWRTEVLDVSAVPEGDLEALTTLLADGFDGSLKDLLEVALSL